MKVFIFDNGINPKNYINALYRLNCTVVYSKNIFDSTCCDGLLLTGGGNIYPKIYNKTPNEFDEYNPMVDLSELYLLHKFYINQKTVLGICKGMQLINVYFGGTLKKVINHQSSKDIYHPIIPIKNTFLHTLFKEEIIVNSAHEEQIDELGKTLKISALSHDKVIEGIQSKDSKVFGVQFHPERLDGDFSDLFYGAFFSC